mmetsp:Transcript_29264/g.59860  ORF Transcript_29264/g.59860 Transcript_29264/m.59860 type:complete len:366 (-) Transcript_29264:141-1238(-)
MRSLALLPVLSLVTLGMPLLEGPVIVGYQNWGACDRNDTITAVAGGVNVVIWFAVNLVANESGEPGVDGGPDYDCVASVAAELDNLGLQTTHLISIGGWDAPHPDSSFTGHEFFDAFDTWNQALPRPFDGFDWDLEGNDNLKASSNAFSARTLNQVLDMSTEASDAGYVVTLVPAQSYFDVSTDEFNLSLLNAYPDFHPDFTYHGANCYAYLVAAAPPRTFAAVTVQLYESWSRADQGLTQAPLQSPRDVLMQWWGELADASAPSSSSWMVDFGDNATTKLRLGGRHAVTPDPKTLVVGLSRGDSQGKSAFFWPKDCGAAYMATAPDRRPRGFAFWNIASEGSGANGTNTALSFAPSLNEFLLVR